jgi:hypothetical protein
MILDLTNPAIMRRFARRWLTSAGNQVAVAVTAAATTVSVTWPRTEGDASYGVLCTPNWATGFGVTAKTTTGCTITFLVAAPVGATVDIATFRSE